MNDKKITFPYIFIKSFTSIKTYKEFLYYPRAKAIAYLVLITLIFSVIGLAPSVVGVFISSRLLSKNLEDSPYFIIENGRFEIDSDTPYVLYDDNKKTYAVLDPMDDIPESILKDYRFGFIVKKTYIIQKTPFNTINVSLESVENFTLTKDDMEKSIGIISFLIIIFTYFFSIFIIILIRLIAAFLLSIFGRLIASVKQYKFTKRQMFVLSCIALTLPTILSSFVRVFGIVMNFYDLVFLLIGLFFLYNAMRIIQDPDFTGKKQISDKNDDN